jgi:hypothetical protein
MAVAAESRSHIATQAFGNFLWEGGGLNPEVQLLRPEAGQVS